MKTTVFMRVVGAIFLLSLITFECPAASLNGNYEGYLSYKRTIKRGNISCNSYSSSIHLKITSVRVKGNVVNGIVNSTVGDKRFKGKVKGNGFIATVKFPGIYYGLRWKMTFTLSKVSPSSANAKLENWSSKNARTYCNYVYSGTIGRS
ncbi:MAG: hypothetical protein GYA55_10520 [SAR324 cluster bacterium]|uniref:Uncharacterized protein n=1 Tax=SAR324 cluster bacterium TaxID=2024889 RepID=A0A7X9IM23_9DELT|nr:hypothetical protein [SAR324 cluster bacterium]